MSNAEHNSPDDPDRAEGLLFGVILDGQGGARNISWADAQSWEPANADETLWLHLDRTIETIPVWLSQGMQLDDAMVDLLISNETRPRAFREGETLVAILRGVNFNPGAKPEDMIAMQIWAQSQRVITLRRRRLQTPRDVLESLASGIGPKTAGDLVTELIEQLVAKMNRAIIDMNDRIDQLEDNVDHDDIEVALDAVSKIRRNCLALKRYMSPQHEALMIINRDAPAWLSLTNQRDVRETIARLHRYLDDLDVSKESALVIQDDLNNRAANQSNRTMYMLSIVAAIFLPLGFITGLLGINVGGMPGVESGSAFWITVVALFIILALQIYVFRKLKWL